MKHNTEKSYCIQYYDPKWDDMIQVHTDSLARAVRGFLIRVKKNPEKRVDLTTGEMHDVCLAIYSDGEYIYQGILKDPAWQEYINAIK